MQTKFLFLLPINSLAKVCADRFASCIEYAVDDDCINDEYIKKWCPFSCGLCEETEYESSDYQIEYIDYQEEEQTSGENESGDLCPEQDPVMCSGQEAFCWMSYISTMCPHACGFCHLDVPEVIFTETAPREFSEKYLNQPTCGSSKARQKRIVGGATAKYGFHPWIVNIYIVDFVNTPSCGASLISDVWVVTAAHCVFDQFKQDLLVAAGDFWTFKRDSYEQKRKVDKIVVHEDYTRDTDDSDIALLLVKRKFVINDYVQPICLPKSGQDVDLFAGAKCDIMGWGDLKKKKSPKLMIATVKLIKFEKCYEYFGEDLTVNMICAGYDKGGIDSCQGDSGGPLVCTGKGGKKVLRGVTSWGNGCARKKSPGVYSDVSLFVDWISSKTKIELKDKRV